MPLSYADAKAALAEKIDVECRRRAHERLAFFAPGGADYLVLKLHEWQKDPVAFVRENAWVADPQRIFGVSPSGFSPRGMIPLVITPKQEAMIRLWHDTLDSPSKCDSAIDKTRQGAVTSYFLWAVAVHGFLFRDSTTGLLGSYADDVIDKGGKGQRDPTSLFGRLRSFLDAFMWNFLRPGTRHSLLAFSQPRLGRRRNKEDDIGLAGMPDWADISYKLTRPRWLLGDLELFPGAEGNWLQGARPGEDFGRSYSATWALLDEVDHYSKHIEAGADRKAWAATNQNVRCRFLIGTPNRGGTGDSLLKEKVHDASTPAVLKSMHFDWCDLPFYMLGAWWECVCGHANPVGPTETPGSGSMDRECGGCRVRTGVTRFRLRSPWLLDSLARMKGDKAGIAAEIMRDWAGTQGDRLFAPWNPDACIRPLVLPDRPTLAMLDGFDPGTSALNPACWLSAVLDVKTMRLQIVGYWMASDTFVEYWVPFLKRWTPEQMRRMRPLYGKKSDNRTFAQAFDYPPDAIAMMERMSRREDSAFVFPPGLVGGDKYGEHRHMAESPYERLRDYGIEPYEEYTTDREALVRQGVEWSARMTVDEAIRDVQPPGPMGPFPSLRQVFSSARVRPNTGQAQFKYDVDKQDPANVSHAVDAWLYLCRLLDEKVRSVATVTGDFEPEGGVGFASEPFRYA